jgi:hypothetical protein
MVSDKDFIDKIHMLIHSLRLIEGYKSSMAERKIGDMIIERFKDTCDECRQRGELLKYAQPQNKSMIDKILGR